MENNMDSMYQAELFRGIKDDELEPMLKCLGSYSNNYNKGDYISFESDNIKTVGLVLEGAVHMIKEDLWGNTTILAFIGPGQVFGETFTCGSNPVSAVTFIASMDTQVLYLPFQRIMQTCSLACVFHHRLIENMVRLIADKNRSLMEKLEVVSKKTLRHKILSYLSLQSQNQGKRQFEIPLGRVELADYLCSDRSALTRELNLLKAEGVLDYSKNTFHLL